MGNYHDTVYAGDYFRVHFNPRRFVDTNKYDWSRSSSSSSSCGRRLQQQQHDGNVIDDDDDDGNKNKPGVIVQRNDEVGYLIINKPPNIPVHARVDNLLENVASSVGRMLWLERREEMVLLSSSSSSNGNSDNDDDDDLTMMISSSMSDDENNYEDDVELWPSGMKKKKKEKKNNRKQQKSDQLVYVATPQRLDQNTSGLLVVATKKSFASYFAKLLRTKTSGQLESGGTSQSSCGVHKSYRCLVCVTPKNDNAAASASMAGEVQRLKKFKNEGTIIKHFLEPSIRAPKHFVTTVPQDADNPESWSECLLKITNITNICTVVGNDPSDALAMDLWGEFGKPNDCVGVIELEIELLTGRTHQIRGQMAALGFPLVGDVQYGGAIPSTSSEYMKNCRGRAEGFLDSEALALQCSTLEFLDPDVTDDSDKVQRSDRWLSFHLDEAFWTPFIERYQAGSESFRVRR
jgi:23S rRNA-/tRNA-specific pseudouridylate synthase